MSGINKFNRDHYRYLMGMLKANRREEEWETSLVTSASARHAPVGTTRVVVWAPSKARIE